MTGAAALLGEKGIRPSFQRVRIFECLSGSKAHPTVEWIWHSLVTELPTLSRTTVYNTLGLFVEAGLAVPIRIGDGELRYDADTREHGHLRCRSCGGVFDFPIEAGSIRPDLPPGFTADLVQLFCMGLCPACQAGSGV